MFTVYSTLPKQLTMAIARPMPTMVVPGKNPRRSHTDVALPDVALSEVYQHGSTLVAGHQHGLPGQTQPHHCLQSTPSLGQASRWGIQILTLQRGAGHLTIRTDQVDRVPVVRLARDGSQGSQRPRRRRQKLSRVQCRSYLPRRRSSPRALQQVLQYPPPPTSTTVPNTN